MTAWRRVLVTSVAVAAVYAAPILGMGFDLDAVAQVDFLEGVRRVDHNFSRLALWNFSDGSEAELEEIRGAIFEGSHPWCAQTVQPADKMLFLRLLPSALMVIDHALFGVAPLGYQAHTLLWFLILLVSVGVLFERVLPANGPRALWRPGLAGGAMLLFAVDATHAEVMSLSSNRHVWVATVFGVWALLAHVRWRTHHWRPGAWLSVAFLLLAMSSSENAFPMLAYIFAFELLRGSDPPGTRLRALLPAALLAVGYVLLYTAAGYGARSHGYIDVFREPELLLRMGPIRFADFLIEELLGLPALFGWQRSTYAGLIRLDLSEGARLALAGGLLIGLGLLVRSVARREPGSFGAVRWLGAGGVLGLAPVILGQPAPRALLVPSIGLTAVIALLIAWAWRGARDRTGSPVHRVILAGLGLATFAVHAVASPPALFRQLVVNRDFSRALVERWLPQETVAPTTWSRPVLEPAGPPVADVVVLAAPSISLPWSVRRELQTLVEGDRPVARPPGQRWWFLSNNVLDYTHVLERTGPDRFDLFLGPERPGPPRSHTLWITCGGAPGQVVAMRTPRVTILDADASGNIRRIRVEFDRPLDDPSLWLATWRDGALRRVVPPPERSRLFLH